MKLSHPLAIKSAALLASFALRGYLSSTTTHLHTDHPETHPRHADRPYAYLFWHEGLLCPTTLFAREKVAALVSNHRDGELIAQIVRMLRGQTIRGSTTRGGATALRQLLRTANARHLAITPDGPKGPRRLMQIGTIYVASATGMPIIPIGVAVHPCWRAKSWDQFILPKPNAQIHLCGSAPIAIPPDLKKDQLELWRTKVQADMEKIQSFADSQI